MRKTLIKFKVILSVFKFFFLNLLFESLILFFKTSLKFPLREIIHNILD